MAIGCPSKRSFKSWLRQQSTFAMTAVKAMSAAGVPGLVFFCYGQPFCPEADLFTLHKKPGIVQCRLRRILNILCKTKLMQAGRCPSSASGTASQYSSDSWSNGSPQEDIRLVVSKACARSTKITANKVLLATATAVGPGMHSPCPCLEDLRSAAPRDAAECPSRSFLARQPGNIA